MAYRNLGEFIQKLEIENELVRIKEQVNPKFEIAEITDRISKNNGPALLFENTGTGFPVFINGFGSYRRMCMALKLNSLDSAIDEGIEIADELISPGKSLLDKLNKLMKLKKVASYMPKVKDGKGECQEVIMNPVNISKLPVLTCWQNDGGPFLTLPIVHTKDPSTGIRNVGMYRMQVFNETTTGMHWHLHKVSARHYNEYKKLGQKMPVAVALGGDPVYTYSATAPLPDNFDEYIFAGFLRKKSVELVKCMTQDIEVPADADFIIEGYVDPQEELIYEGPFGDHTGFYSLADYYPKFHITCITHKKNAVYPATIVGIPPQEDAWLGKATERIFLNPIKMAIAPEIIDIEMPVEGVFHNMVITKIKKTYAGQALKVMNALWGAGQMMFTKVLVVVDENVDIRNYESLAKVISENVDPMRDFHLSEGPLDVLDHSSNQFTFGGKLGIDATIKLKEEQKTIESDTKNIEDNKIDIKNIYEELPEISDINLNLLSRDISIAVITIKKKSKFHIKEINNLLFKNYFKNIKMIIYLDYKVEDNGDIFWLTLNNIDTFRDCYIVESDEYKISHIGIDATIKTKEIDGFEREWPEIIVTDNETIKLVDKKWDKYNLGKFIQSPSIKYQNYRIL